MYPANIKRFMPCLIVAILISVTPLQTESIAADLPSTDAITNDWQNPMIVNAANKPQGVSVRRASFQQKIYEIPPMENHVWRKTPDGWKQVPMEPPPFIHQMNLPHRPPKVHPFSVASLTLLLCLAAMAWGSSEWEWNRFIGESD